MAEAADGEADVALTAPAAEDDLTAVVFAVVLEVSVALVAEVMTLEPVAYGPVVLPPGAG